MINYSLLQAQSQPSSAKVVNDSIGSTDGFGSLLTGLKGLFGTNSVEQANKAISDSLSNADPSSIANSLLPGSALPRYQGSQPTGYPPSPSQSPQQALNNNLSLSNVNGMVQQAFPNDPVRQKLALAQAAQESGLLTHPSQLASQYNNLYGIKGQGTAGSVSLPTTEYVNGVPTKTNAQFASYKTPQDSIDAYAKLINKPNYKGILQAGDLQGAAMAAQKAGYATDPNYAKNVVNTFNKVDTLLKGHTSPTPYIATGAPISKEMASTPAYQQSSQSYVAARKSGLTKSPYYVSVDFSQPAAAKRLSVINAETGKVIFQSEVAQGKPGFSNTPGSNQSSLGTFITDQTYNGKHGYSMRIKGLDKGVNDNAYARDVVVHGGDYIGNGKTGRSFGCFTVPEDVAPKLINLIKGGTIIHSYGQEEEVEQRHDPVAITGVRG